MTKMMPDLEAIKLTKIKEYCEKTVLTGKMPKIAPEGGAKPGANKPAPKGGSTAPKKVSRPPAKKPSVPAKKQATPVEDEDEFGMDEEPAAPPPQRKTSSAPSRRGAPAGAFSVMGIFH